jgi:hypothetical protein
MLMSSLEGSSRVFGNVSCHYVVVLDFLYKHLSWVAKFTAKFPGLWVSSFQRPRKPRKTVKTNETKETNLPIY